MFIISILKQAPLNSNQYNTDLDNNKTSDLTLAKNDTMLRNPTLNQKEYEMDNNEINYDNEETGCLGRVKNLYTNPDTPCQNYLMIFLTVVCAFVTLFVLYMVFVKQ